ncbi:hypothetical protein M9458_044058, partial [Cirrhinus mrigala]
MDVEVKQRRQEKERLAQEQRQVEEQQRLMAQRQEFFPTNLYNTSLPPPNLASLPTQYISFPSFPSIKTPLEEFLDLRVHSSSSSSQVNTQADLGVDNLSRQPEPTVDFSLEEFIQEQPQQESQATQESISAQDKDLYDMILSLDSFITPPSQTVPASSSSDAPSSVPMVFSTSLSPFTPSLTPSSSSSSLSQDQQMLPLPNSYCSSEAIINVRE